MKEFLYNYNQKWAKSKPVDEIQNEESSITTTNNRKKCFPCQQEKKETKIYEIYL